MSSKEISKLDLDEEGIQGGIYGKVLLFSLWISKMAAGMAISLWGPTLLAISINVGAPISTVGFLYTFLDFGILIGGILGGYIPPHWNRNYTFFGGMAILAGSAAGIPFATTVWLLFILAFFEGFAFGFLDSVRAFDDGGASDGCPEEDAEADDGNSTGVTTTTNLYSSTEAEYGNYIVYPYLITAAFNFLCALFCLVNGIIKVDRHIKFNDATLEESEPADTRPIEPFRKIYPLIILVVIFFVFALPAEILFTGYIYSVSVCSDLAMTTQDAALLSTVTWSGYLLSRIVLMFAAKYISPEKILGTALVGCLVFITMEVIWGETILAIAWIVAFSYGFFCAVLYPGGINLTSKYTNVSGSYIAVFSVGSAIGAMVLMPLAGIVFEQDPMYVMWMTLICCVISFIVYILIIAYQRYRISRMPKSVTQTAFTNKMMFESNASITKM